jgi:hypothetical protein
MSKELTLQEAALAWAQGKRVEVKEPFRKDWGLVCEVGKETGKYTPRVFICPDYQFRLAPEPPAKRYRPWTPEEVPVGALVRPNEQLDEVLMIVGRNAEGVWLSTDDGWYNYRDLFGDMKHSIDPIGTPANKRTWLPCGVEVSE